MTSNHSLNWQRIKFLFAFMLISSTSQAQEFPIDLHSNGADLYVESMAVGPDGDIYVTGRTGNYNQFTFGPNGFNVAISPFYPPLSAYDDIFIARFHPDPISPDNTLEWLVIGRSSTVPSPLLHSGKDIEVDASGNAYIVGSMHGNVDFTCVYGGTFPTVSSCAGSMRHFVTRINSDGSPQWVADSKPITMAETFGEAIAIDAANDRIITGGYVAVNDSSALITMRNEDCTDQCSFTAIPTPTGHVGFVTEYDLNGVNYRVGEVGERVMALTINQAYPEQVWATGSVYNTDLDVMLADMFMDFVDVPCINFSVNFMNIWGEGNDIGLDIDREDDGNVVLTGVFTDQLNWFPGPGGPLGTAPGNTDIFVGKILSGTMEFTTTSLIPGGVPSTELPLPYNKRSSCIAADHTNSESQFIIGYDASSDGLLETQAISATTLFPYGAAQTITPIGVGDFARAMEIDYSSEGYAGKRFLAGDFFNHSAVVPGFHFGPGGIIGSSGTHWEGYVTRLDSDHIMTALILGDEELDQDLGIDLFPNPAENQVTLRTDINDASVKVFDSKGRVLIEKEHLNAGEHTFDIDSFTAGVYIVTFSNSEGNATKKLIIN